MKLVLGDENCRKFLEEDKGRPNDCLWCGETPVVAFSEDGTGQMVCSCGASGPRYENFANGDLSVKIITDEWNMVHDRENFERTLYG